MNDTNVIVKYYFVDPKDRLPANCNIVIIIMRLKMN